VQGLGFIDAQTRGLTLRIIGMRAEALGTT
jgi:hypothetical protein